MWRVCKAAGRPFPQVSEDDVIDFLVCEAISIKVAKEDKNAIDAAKKNEWKQGHSDLRQKLT